MAGLGGLDDILPLHLADVVYPSEHPRSGTGPVYAFALRTARGVVLVDTGLGGPHAIIDEMYRPTRRDLTQELLRRGISPNSVSIVINTHLHFDHCGANALFSGLPIVVQRSEYEAARAQGYAIPEWVDFPGAKYELLTGDAEIADGIRAISTPGQTAGHQSVVVETREGVGVIAGQAAETAEEFEEAMPGDESVRKLADLSPARVYFSHDHSVWQPRSPPAGRR